MVHHAALQEEQREPAPVGRLDKPRGKPPVHEIPMTMTNLLELGAKWEARRLEHKRLGSLVSMEAVCSEVVADLSALADSSDDTVSLREAHRIGGYSVDHLQRLVRRGTIPNMGRKGRPRIRRVHVPTRAGHALPSDAEASQFGSRRRMALAVITSKHGGD